MPAPLRNIAPLARLKTRPEGSRIAEPASALEQPLVADARETAARADDVMALFNGSLMDVSGSWSGGAFPVANFTGINLNGGLSSFSPAPQPDTRASS